jgi:hypothetical protein
MVTVEVCTNAETARNEVSSVALWQTYPILWVRNLPVVTTHSGLFRGKAKISEEIERETYG